MLTTPSVKSQYMISGTPGPTWKPSRLNAPWPGAEIEIERGVLPVGLTCVMKIEPVRNCRPGLMFEMSNTVNVLAEELVASRTLAAWPPPVWFERPPGLGVLMIATGSDVRVFMMTIWPDWNDWM